MIILGTSSGVHVSETNDMSKVSFLKGCVITPQEVKRLSARSNPVAVIVLARARAQSAKKWTPLADTGDINLDEERSQIAVMQAERVDTIIDCKQLLMPKKQRGIIEGTEFVSHGKNQFKLEGMLEKINQLKLMEFCIKVLQERSQWSRRKQRMHKLLIQRMYCAWK